MVYLDVKAKWATHSYKLHINDRDGEFVVMLIDGDTDIAQLRAKSFPNDNEMWLEIVEVNQKYQRQRLGQALLTILEAKTIMEFNTTVRGKFFPYNNTTKKEATAFYNKCGYSVDKEYYSTEVYKYISPSKNELQALKFELKNINDQLEQNQDCDIHIPINFSQRKEILLANAIMAIEKSSPSKMQSVEKTIEKRM